MIKKYLAFCLILGLSPVYASIECPAKINVTQQLSDTTSDDWRSLNLDSQHFLSGISFYAGKPEDLASLKPDVIKKTSSTWNFSSKDNVYVVCSYNQTSIQLTKALSNQNTQCTVKYDTTMQGDKGFIPKSVECK